MAFVRSSQLIRIQPGSIARNSAGRDGFRSRLPNGLRSLALVAGLTGIVLTLSACGGSTLETFNINAPREGISARAGQQIVVVPPSATAPFDGDRLVVRTQNGSFAYVKGSQWVDALPRLMQARLIQTFDNTRALNSVGRPGDSLVAALALNTEIRRFEIDVASGEAVVEIAAKLVASLNGRIVAARIFTARMPGSASDGAKASAALDQAAQSVLRAIVNWAGGAR